MTASARDILSLIEQIGGAKSAQRVREICAGKKINLSVAALLSEAHPFRRALDATTMAQVIEAIRHDLRRGDNLRFPALAETAYVRARRERAARLQRLISAGQTTTEIARLLRVSKRTVENHRARMRREGLLPAGGTR